MVFVNFGVAPVASHFLQGNTLFSSLLTQFGVVLHLFESNENMRCDFSAKICHIFEPVNSDLKPIHGFWDDVNAKTDPA